MPKIGRSALAAATQVPNVPRTGTRGAYASSTAQNALTERIASARSGAASRRASIAPLQREHRSVA